MDIRRITDRDFGEFDRVLRRSGFVGEPSDEQLKHFFARLVAPESNLIFLGAFHEGTLAGIVSVTFGESSYRLAPFAWCDDLYVDLPYRRQGVAKQLMNEVSQLAKQRQCSNVLLGVGHREVGPLKLYESLGFVDLKCKLLSLPLSPIPSSDASE